MGLFSSLGGSALGGVFTNALGSLNAFHDFENDSGYGKVIDPLGAAIGGINQRAAKKQTSAQLAFANSLAGLEYAYQKQAAQEMPKLIRKGYEDAGYNALLALGNTGGATSAVRAASMGAPEIAPRGRAELNPLLVESLKTAKAQREQIEEKTKDISVQRKMRIVDSLIDGAKTVGTIIAARHLAKNYKGAVTHSAKSAGEFMRGIPESKAPWNKKEFIMPASVKTLLPALAAVGLTSAVSYGKSWAETHLGRKLPDVTEPKYQRKNPRSTARPSSLDFRKINQYHNW